MTKKPHIIADYREKHSGIPETLMNKEINISFSQLKTGDYLIDKHYIIERKTAEDFVQSLISGRLFKQCAILSKTGMKPLLLLEGNPYKTEHDIDKNAVKGAMLSVMAAWQIPVMYSKDKEDSVLIMTMLVHQSNKHVHLLNYNNYKPKRLKSHRLRFLQGLPKIGAVTAQKLLEHFGSIEAVIKADEKALTEVNGIGKNTAQKIRSFLSPHCNK